MNRAERRKLEKQGYSRASIMKQYGSEAYDAGYKAGLKDVTEIMFYLTAYTIQYKLGFGRKRLHRIMKQIFFNIDSFRTGQLEVEDYQTIKSEMQNKYKVNML